MPAALPAFGAPPPRLDVTLSDGALRVAVHGELDVASSPALDRVLADAAPATHVLTIDLQPCTFIDSSVIALLLSTRARFAGDGGRLVVLAGDGQVRRTLEIAGVSDLLTAPQQAE